MTSSASLLEVASKRHSAAMPDIVDRRILELPGSRSVAFAQTGSGPDCLVIHGTLMTLEDMWLGPTAALSEHFRVTAVDRPGHGMSLRRRQVDASPWRQAEILHDFATAAGLQQPVVIGHSFGGTVALAYAMLYPEDTRGVVALAPMCLPELRIEAFLFGPRGIAGLGDMLAPSLGSTIDPVLLQPLWRAMFLPQAMPDRFSKAFPFSLAARFGQMIAEGEDALALPPGLLTMAARFHSCQVPTRFLGGTADIVVNNAVQGRIASTLMPEATFAWINGAGHMLHHFARAEILEAALSLG